MVCLLCVVLCAPSPAAQDDGGPEELASDALAVLGEACKRYEYETIEEALLDFDLVWDKVSDKTRKKIEKGIAGVLSTRPAREIDYESGTDPATKLLPAYELCAGILFDKPDGDEVLADALKHKHVKDWPDARALLVEALGAREDATLVPLLITYLEDEDAGVVVAAAKACGVFSEETPEVRRTATAALIEAWLAHHDAAEKEAKRSKGKEEERAEFLLRVEGAFASSLTSIARQSFTEVGEWRDWFAEAGSKEGL